jgi:hypothetical protein
MVEEEGPICPRHSGEVHMRLRTIHSDHSRPDRLLGLYECPECGYERRLPIELRAQAVPA